MAQSAAVPARRVRMPLRNAQLGELLDTFLVCAAAAVVLLRVYLELTGYPQLGGGGLHIAHVLWGGLGMAVAIGILLSFLSHRARLVAAIVGGAGFGTFIDELGKFVTSDNNYFFRPTAALIYVIFVIAFLAGRAIRSGGRLGPVESVANAIDVLQEACGRQLDAVSRDRALALLSAAGDREPLVPSLRTLFLSLPVAERSASAATRLRSRLNGVYLRVVRARWFRRVVVILFALQALRTVVTVALFGVMGVAVLTGIPGVNVDNSVDLPDAIGTVASVFSGAFAVAGIVLLRRSRVRAYRAFELALMTDLLLVLPFSLLVSEFGALSGVIFDLLLLAVVRYLLNQERSLLLGDRVAEWRRADATPT
jgi:hypothetical protein